MKDKKKFSQLMMALSETFDKEVTTVLSRVYWSVFQKYSDEQFENAVNLAIVKCTYFPKPAELLEFINGNQGDQSLLAWEKVYKAMISVGAYQSVSFDDPAIHSCIEMMGGWPELCMTRKDEIKWKQKDFEAAYKVMSKQKNHKDHVVGLVELQNNSRGFLAYLPGPVMIGERGQLMEPKIKPKGLK